MTVKSKRDKRRISPRRMLRSVTKSSISRDALYNRSRFNADLSLSESDDASDESEAEYEGKLSCMSAPTGYASHNEALQDKPPGTFGGVNLEKEIPLSRQGQNLERSARNDRAGSSDFSIVRRHQKLSANHILGSNQAAQSGFSFGSAATFAMPAGGFVLEDCCDFPAGSSMFCSPLTSSNIPEKIIPKMPTYSLEIINLYEEKEFEFSPCSYDSNYESIFLIAKRKKMQLLNVISMALMFSSNLKNESDNYRVALQKSIDDVMLIEPEFILKVALYARQELQIRTVSNFLLSCAAVHQNARMYLEKYFEASIVLPSDWIEVAEYFQVLSGGQNRRPFPAALRRAMRKCFQKFDKYQLAKYNRADTKKKQKIEEVLADTLHLSDSEDDHNRQPAVTKGLTLKKLIRTLHIDSPSEHVMCLLEKKYPRNQEEFRSSGLTGVWDSKQAGKRMKLPTPETWETRISACGNKPAVWESLIDNNKLPYMATFRNLRNLILSGISAKHHKKIISNLQNKKFVMNSRQLPMQYFEAYKVLQKLEFMIDIGGILEKDNSSRPVPDWQKMRLKKMQEKVQNASVSLVAEYKAAVCKALEISSMSNLHPIPGKTLIICQLDQDMGAKAKSYELCRVMGFMCLKACEDCKMCNFSSAKKIYAISLKEDDPFLDELMKAIEKCQ